MRIMNILTLALVIVGGVNWLLVGLAQFDLVAALFGDGSVLSNIVYTVVGMSALWQLMPFARTLSLPEPMAQAAR